MLVAALKVLFSSFMVRWLMLLVVVLSGSLGFAADALFLSDAEKALVALLLKSAQEVSDDRKSAIDFQTQKMRFEEIIKKLKLVQRQQVQYVQVKSFEEFLLNKSSNPFFHEFRLDELNDNILFEMLKVVRYQSHSARVQKKIDAYESNRRQWIAGFFAKLGLHFTQVVGTDQINLGRMKADLQEAFNQKIEALTGSLNPHDSLQVKVLSKLMKAYFRNLPQSQKIEIVYRLSLMPLNSAPMDVFLTMIQNAGPQMQKLVQIMGRSEHIPQEFQEIFQKLESQVRSVPWWKVKKRLELLNFKFSEFVYFERKPIGVGTMAQTHRAQYIDEQGNRHSVVIRFLKPEIEKYLEMDHQILKTIASEIDHDPELKPFGLPSLEDLVDDLHQSVVEELDSNATVRSQILGRQTYLREQVIFFNGQKNILRINVPNAKVYSNGVMIQELVIGKKPAKEFAQYKEIYPDLYRVVSERIAEIWVEEAFFKSGFFHADLHQGNLLASYEDNAITVHVLDFGMTGQLSLQLKKSALLLALGIKLERADLMAEHFLKLGTISDPEITAAKLSLLIRQKMNQLKVDDPERGGSLEGWTAWAMDLGLDLHYEFLKLNRGLTAIEGLLSDSKSRLDIEKLAQKVALRHKGYVSQLLLQESKMHFTDFGKLIFSTLANAENKRKSSTALQLKCTALFN